MTLEELHGTVEGLHGTVEKLHGRVEKLHGTVEELHRTVVDGFGDVHRRFAQVDERFISLRADLEAHIHEEGETTRRHFEAVAERMEASVRIIAEGHGHLRTIVDNHEVRLQSLEKRT